MYYLYLPSTPTSFCRKCHFTRQVVVITHEFRNSMSLHRKQLDSRNNTVFGVIKTLNYTIIHPLFEFAKHFRYDELVNAKQKNSMTALDQRQYILRPHLYTNNDFVHTDTLIMTLVT